MNMLDGKVIIVTGAGRGVGRAHARLLAQQGAKLVINDIGAQVNGLGEDKGLANAVAEEIRSEGGSAIGNATDISDWQAAGGLIEAALQEFGRLDGIVNNAGNLRKIDLADLTETDFDAQVDVHLKGSFACTAHACRYWRDRFASGVNPKASVINTFSDAVLIAMPTYTAYGAAKAGIMHMTIAGSREAIKYGVRINAYGPRALTRMMPGYFEGMENTDKPHPKDPGNSSPLVAWLLSDDAAHVSGQVFQTVGGGIARCTPWTPGPLIWPPEGEVRFTLDEVGGAINSQIFNCAFPNLILPNLRKAEDHKLFDQ